MPRVVLACVAGALLLAVGGARAEPSASARILYERAVARDREVRAALVQPDLAKHPGVRDFRDAIAAYRRVVRQHPSSGYCDNALWQAALLAVEAFDRFGDGRDRDAALSLMRSLVKEYPSSSFVRHAQATIARVSALAGAPARPSKPDAVARTADVASAPPAAVVIAPDAPPAPGAAATPAASPPSAAAAVPAADSTAPAAPTSNVRGGYSLARQLGLGASRIVIDPGHGGYDPGAMVGKTTEAAISLDIALQLEKLLLKQPGIEVILTRRADTFLALQERTEIANRERADLFISIHVNASRNKAARGVETFLLDFASTPDAEAVAARENASSSMTMSHLNELVKKIALTTKADESRDLAVRVQRTMVRRLKPHNSAMRDLGVRSAPFVVLIGASMPSILVETAFLTHKQEGKLLARPAYRQHVAEALDEGVRHYLQSLKRVSPVVQQPGPAGPAGRPGGGGTREPLQYP